MICDDLGRKPPFAHWLWKNLSTSQSTCGKKMENRHQLLTARGEQNKASRPTLVQVLLSKKKHEKGFGVFGRIHPRWFSFQPQICNPFVLWWPEAGVENNTSFSLNVRHSITRYNYMLHHSPKKNKLLLDVRIRFYENSIFFWSCHTFIYNYIYICMKSKKK